MIAQGNLLDQELEEHGVVLHVMAIAEQDAFKDARVFFHGGIRGDEIDTRSAAVEAALLRRSLAMRIGADKTARIRDHQYQGVSVRALYVVGLDDVVASRIDELLVVGHLDLEIQAGCLGIAFAKSSDLGEAMDVMDEVRDHGIVRAIEKQADIVVQGDQVGISSLLLEVIGDIDCLFVPDIDLFLALSARFELEVHIVLEAQSAHEFGEGRFGDGTRIGELPDRKV